MIFWDNIKVLDNGCWLWLGHIDASGYAKYHKRYVATTTHRYALESYLGRDLLPNHDAHHLCKVTKACICPMHLEEVPKNKHPGGGAEIQRSKTHCIYGHEFTEENIIPNKKGQRICRKCRSLVARRMGNTRARLGALK